MGTNNFPDDILAAIRKLRKDFDAFVAGVTSLWEYASGTLQPDPAGTTPLTQFTVTPTQGAAFSRLSVAGGAAVSILANDGVTTQSELGITGASGFVLDVSGTGHATVSGSPAGFLNLFGPEIIFARAESAPPDGDLSESQFALWLDATPGATALMVKAKDSGGTVRTAAIALT